jgi:PAS domain S-box-containing protein
MFQSIIDNSQSAIYVKDLNGRFLMANAPLLEFLGEPEEDVLGQPDYAVVDEVDPQWRLNDARAEGARRAHHSTGRP